MNTQPLEHDLLDLVEGRLAPDRVEAVRAALSKDPAMLRMVEHMVADRRGIVDLSKATAQASRADRSAAEAIVREAIERAEREALFASGASGRRRRFSPIAAAAAMVAVVGLAAASVTWYLLERNKADQLADAKKIERSGEARMTPMDESDAAPAFVGPALPEREGVSSESHRESREVASLPSWFKSNPDPHAKETVRSWAESVEKTLSEPDAKAESASEIAARALARIQSGGSSRLGIDEAAALSLSRRLRLVVPAAGLDWSRRRAEIVSAAIRAAPRGDASADAAENSLERGELNVEVNAPIDTELAALRDALGDMRKRFGEPGAEGGWFELDGTGDDEAPALPSLRLNDILWWSNGPSAWRPGVSVRVRVEARE